MKKATHSFSFLAGMSAFLLPLMMAVSETKDKLIVGRFSNMRDRLFLYSEGIQKENAPLDLMVYKKIL
jgi:hypothetical protein